MKEMTLVGYYTSEIGATRELRPNPHVIYDGNVPLTEVGRTYSF
jgi:hypothetical protein